MRPSLSSPLKPGLIPLQTHPDTALHSLCYCRCYQLVMFTHLTASINNTVLCPGRNMLFVKLPPFNWRCLSLYLQYVRTGCQTITYFNVIKWRIVICGTIPSVQCQDNLFSPFLHQKSIFILIIAALIVGLLHRSRICLYLFIFLWSIMFITRNGKFVFSFC